MKRRFGRGILVLVALGCAASGALRLGFGVGEVMALVPAESDEAADQCAAPPSALAEALTQRESRLTERESALAERMAALGLAEKALDARLAELAEAKKSLMEVVEVADGAAEQDLVRLTAVYEAMKPAEAARLFAAMAPDFAAGFLGRMQPGSAAAVMASLDPEIAYRISALIAGRNANAPKE